jgi:hypothetical protein
MAKIKSTKGQNNHQETDKAMTKRKVSKRQLFTKQYTEN